MANKNIDYLVVGQGIAGTCISFQLLKRGLSFLVIDNGHKTSASKVAAGLYNPIVFKRFTQSWMAEELINYMDDFYSKLEDLLQEKFHRKLPIVKIFTNEAEVALWKKKAEFDIFLNPEFRHDYYLDSLTENAGVSNVINSGAVDIAKLISCFNTYLKNNKYEVEESFDYDKLIATNDSITYKNITAKAIIFCEGAYAINNPYFTKNAFKLTHGELIEINASNLPTNEVINKGVFILPTDTNTYKVGATYEWDKVDGEPSKKGLNEIKIKLETVLKQSYTVVNHKAGIRPTVADRRPLVGNNEKNKNIYFLNGLGTKGVMLAPYFSEQLLNLIVNKKPIDQEVDINRYSK